MNEIQPRVNKWLITFTVMFPTFIEVMDTTVVNVALPHIQGSMSAGLDEASWVLTSYLVSNAIIIPVSGWLAGIFGRRRYLIFSLLLFTAGSVLSGAATSLMMLVFFRVIQGIGGGGLQPLSQAILLESFPMRERGMAMAIFGMGVVLAPTIGPIVGGYLTDRFSWRWIFYLNLPAGILATYLVFSFIYDPPYLKRLKVQIDTWGLFLLSVGLGTLQIVLDKGQRENWFSSDYIIWLSAVSVVTLAAFLVVESTTPYPVINLRIFRSRSFTAGCVIMFAGFLSVFGSLVLLPLYVQELLGYTAYWAGLVLGPGGISAFFIMPITGNLLKRGVDPRRLLLSGLLFNFYALWLMSGFNLDAAFMDLVWPRVILGFGLGLFFVPLATSTFARVPMEEMGNASGIFNLLRNMGGSFGVAISTTLLARRSQVHQVFLVDRVNPFSRIYQGYYGRVDDYLTYQHPSVSHGNAPLDFIYQQVQAQAQMLAFNDAFWALALLTAVLIPLTFFFRKPRN